MTSLQRWLLVLTALIVVAAGAWLLISRSALPTTFLEAARDAETVADPMQRCLDYPDPPGSHWSREVVSAYCQYQTQPVIPFSRVKRAIESGQAAQLDQTLADALREQQTSPASRGLVDRIYCCDFSNGSMVTRHTLDSWKQQSPNSAFAYAASGLAYVFMAHTARGERYAIDTPESNFAAMDQLLLKARSDLNKATQLNPRIIPAYVGMIYANGLDDDTKSALAVARRGLKIDPTNYYLYEQLLWLAQPQWSGSRQDTQLVAAEALKHVAENPLLLLFLPEAHHTIEELASCECRTSAQVAVLQRAFDQVSSSDLLYRVGGTLAANGHEKLGTIYLSEALRFNPRNVNAIAFRSESLMDLGESSWALAEANHAVSLGPRNKEALYARGYVLKAMHDYGAAERDFYAALALVPNDANSLDELGRIYVYATHQWEKGWDAANRLIRAHPDNPEGWILRASIQKDQPRPGLHDTIKRFITRFGDDPSQQRVIAEMQQTLAQDRLKGNKSQ